MERIQLFITPQTQSAGRHAQHIGPLDLLKKTQSRVTLTDSEKEAVKRHLSKYKKEPIIEYTDSDLQYEIRLLESS